MRFTVAWRTAHGTRRRSTARIGELATRTGVSVRALRYDEEQGLVYPTRTDGGQRRYPEAAVERVRLVPLLHAAGLPSRTVREILPCLSTGGVSPDMLDRFVAEHDRIDRQVRDLAAARDRLADIIATVPRAADAAAG